MQLLNAWAGDAGQARSAGAMTIIPDAIFNAWHTAVRRWCVRHVLVDWHALILRPARMHVTPTHIDVIFAPAQAEISLRRAALDVDPGWVPWLGRVIRFHYVNPDERIR